jgi:hypothetical protein
MHPDHPATAAATLPTALGLAAVSESAQMKRSPAHDRQGARPRRARGPLTRAALALFAAVTVTAGCSSNSATSPPAGASHSPAAAASASSAAAGLAGEWERVTTCQELVSELDKAGLVPLAPNAWSGQTSSTGLSSFAPGSPKPTKARPCTGALSREHSHFFSQSGQFGSLDWLGGQVDNGPYRIINDNTVYIGSPLSQRHSTTASCAATRSCCRSCLPRPCFAKRSRILTSSARRSGP